MDANLKKVLRAISLELRHTLEGTYDERGDFQPGDLEQRLNAIGVWRDRAAKPLAELTHLPAADKAARQTIDAYLHFRAEAGVTQAEAVAEFVREAAYNWANRLLTLRCMEARGLIDEVVLQKEVYGWRSMVHNRLGQRVPALLAQPDEGLFTVLLAEFGERARELPALFNPKAPAIALRPSLAALKKCIGLLSGTVKAGSYQAEGDDLFAAPDALGWAYQYWNAEEKDRVFEKVRTEKGAKIAGADIIPATQLYTEPYMVKFLVQNSLGALWQGMHPDSDLADGWEYYVRDADRAPVAQKPVRDITFLDPACGSGHFHLEAFDLLYAMYEAEANLQSPISNPQSPEAICATILDHNLYGIDIDERAIQIAQAALWMKAKEVAWELEPEALTGFHHHFVATNIKLPQGVDHLEAFLRQHPEDLPLRPALETVFEGLENAHELGSLLQLEEPVEKELRYLQGKQAEATQTMQQGELFAELAKPRQGELPLGVESYDAWKAKTLAQLRAHFEAEAEAADLTYAFFGQSAGKGLALFNILAKRYDIVAANPPYLSFRNVGKSLSSFLRSSYSTAPTDTYSAMVWRALDLLKQKNGFLAFVTQDGLLLLPSLNELRERILKDFQIEAVVHLGPRAFEDIGGEKVSVSLTTIRSNQPKSIPIWIRLVQSQNKERDLAEASSQQFYRVANGLSQNEYLRTKNKQWLYFVPKRFIDILAEEQTLSAFALVKQGIITGDNDKYIRAWREIPQLDNSSARWVPYYWGSEDIIWGADGYPIHTIDWRNGATWRFVRPRAPELRFRHGITFGRLGKEFRIAPLPKTALFDVNASAAIFKSNCFEPWIFAFLSAPIITATLQALNVSLTFLVEDIAGVPIPSDISDESKLSLTNSATKLIKFASDYAKNELFSSSWQLNTSEISQSDRTTLEKEESLYSIDEVVQLALGLTKKEADLLRELASITLEIENSGSDDIEDLFHSDKQSNITNLFSFITLRLLGHRWPKQIEAGEPIPAWADSSGIIPITISGHSLPTILDRVRDRLAADFPNGNGVGATNAASIEREFADIVGEKLADWLAGSFFTHHISQFKKRPIAWQVQTSPAPGQRQRGGPAFASLLYYHKLSANLLPTLRNQLVRDLTRAYETEQRTLRHSQSLTGDQEARLRQLDIWLAELQAFSNALQFVSDHGFGDTLAQQAALRQFALDDAMQSLKATWLGRLAAKATSDALPDWQTRADKTGIHPALRDWIAAATANLAHHCAQVGAPAPKAAKLKTDPDARALAVIIGTQAKEMVAQSLKLAGDAWFSELDEHLLRPLLDEINGLKAEVATLEEKRDELDTHDVRGRYETEQKIKSLKAQIKQKTKERNDHRKAAKELREHIESWRCPIATSWTEWLGQQPLFDQFASLDGQRQPPQTIAEFVAQESRYVPDINDGVRVNIAPLQKAGLLAADVLAAKDIDKAIADRAEWRADERRWCREGKLPRPGWWE